MAKIIIASNGNRFVEAMFLDLLESEEVILWNKEYYFKNKIEYFLFKIHTSKKINNIIKLPKKEIWFKKHNYARAYPFSDSDSYHIIMFNPSFEFYPEDDLINLAKKDNIEISVVLIDSCKKKETQLFEYFRTKIKFKSVTTFDKSDAEEYKFEYSHEMYSRFPVANKSKIRYSDIYFIGYNKGRANKICELERRLSAKGVKCDFTINGSLEEISEVDNPNVHTDRYASYQDVIDEIQGTRCIFEMLQEGQRGTTLRYYEAVCYNKKLLTNNTDIVSYPYYDSSYMKIYTNIEDIDVEWLMEPITVDYKYRGEFSPLYYLKKISV